MGIGVARKTHSWGRKAAIDRLPADNRACYDRGMDTKPSQFDKFKEAARELETDVDEKRWEERLKKIAKAKPGKPE